MPFIMENKNKLKICALFTCSSVLFSECLVISLRIALISGGMHIKEKKFLKGICHLP